MDDQEVRNMSTEAEYMFSSLTTTYLEVVSNYRQANVLTLLSRLTRHDMTSPVGSVLN